MSLENAPIDQTDYTRYNLCKVYSLHDLEVLGVKYPREEWHGYVDTEGVANGVLYNHLIHTFNEPGLENYQETHKTKENPKPSQAERLSYALKYTDKLAEDKEPLFINTAKALEDYAKTGGSSEEDLRQIITSNLQEHQIPQFEAWRHLNEARLNLGELRGPVNWRGLASVALRKIPRESEAEEAAILDVVNAEILYKETLLSEAISFIDHNKTGMSRRLFFGLAMGGLAALAGLTSCGTQTGGANEEESTVAEKTSITPEDHEFLELLMTNGLEPVELIFSRDGDAPPKIQFADDCPQFNADESDLMGLATIAIPATAFDPIPGDEVVAVAILLAAGGILYIGKHASQIQKDRRITSHSDPRHDLGLPSGEPARNIIHQILTGGVTIFCYAVTFLNNNKEITRYVVTTAVKGSPYLSLMGVFGIDKQGNPRWITAYPYAGHPRDPGAIARTSEGVVAAVAETCTENLPAYGRW